MGFLIHIGYFYAVVNYGNILSLQKPVWYVIMIFYNIIVLIPPQECSGACLFWGEKEGILIGQPFLSRSWRYSRYVVYSKPDCTSCLTRVTGIQRHYGPMVRSNSDAIRLYTDHLTGYSLTGFTHVRITGLIMYSNILR